MMLRRGVRSLYKIHAWTGLAGGLLLIVVTVSGSVAVFKTEIDGLANPALRSVEPRGERLPWADLLGGVLAKYPAAKLNNVSVPHAPNEAVTVLLRRPKLGALQVSVDPYDGRILAARSPRGTLADTVRQFHVRLLISSWGRPFVGVLGVLMVVSTVAGILIYAPMNKRSWMPRFRRGAGTRVFLADLHKVVGLGSLGFNLMFAVTGAVLGLEVLYYRYFPPARAGTQVVRPADAPAPAELVEGCLRTAERAIPGTEADLVRMLSGGRVRVDLAHPITDLVKDHVSHVTFDATGRTILERYDARSAGFWERAYYSCEPLHFGQFGGMPVKLLYALVGLATGVLSVSGYVIYAIRLRNRWRGSRTRTRRPVRVANAVSLEPRDGASEVELVQPSSTLARQA